MNGMPLSQQTGCSTQATFREEIGGGALTTPPLLLLRLASMLSAWVATGLVELLVCWGADRPMMLPRFSGCAFGRGGIPPPAAAIYLLQQDVTSRGDWQPCCLIGA